VQTENKARIPPWLPWLIVPASQVLLVVPSLTWTPSRADENKPKNVTVTSYDQIAPGRLFQKFSLKKVLITDKDGAEKCRP